MDLITFAQAKKLKELGFNEPCLHYYELSGELRESQYLPIGGVTEYSDLLRNFNSEEYGDNYVYFSCPTQAQVVEWLRVTHQIFVSVRLTDISERKFNYAASIWFFSDKEQGCIDEYSSNIDAKTWRVDSPQKAYSVAFDYIFNNYKF